MIPSVILFLLVWQGAPAAPSPPVEEPARGLLKLSAALNTLIQAHNKSQAHRFIALNNDLQNRLDALNRTLTKAMITRVDRHEAPPLTLEAKTDLLFGQTPMLGAGPKPDRLVLESRARNLFLYGVQLESDRDLYLSRVVLETRDGGTFQRIFEEGTVHKAKTPLEVTASDEDEGQLARRLRRIIVEGYVAGREARALTVSLVIPDPPTRPYRRAMDTLNSIRVSWSGLTIDAQGLAKRKQDLQILAQALFLPTPELTEISP